MTTANLKTISMQKPCKLENNLYAEAISSLKVLIRNKNTIQKGDKDNKVVITDKEKCTEGVKKATSEFFQLNITPHKCVISLPLSKN